jgi:hypothetical protein
MRKMWIEIYEKEYGGLFLVNTDLIQAIKTDKCDSEASVDVTLPYGSIFLKKPFYHALIMALQGQDVDLGELGHVRPLKNGKREELYKHLSYLEAMDDCIFKKRG